MAGLNFRNAYEFDPETYSGQSAGGLPGMIERAIREQNLQRVTAPGSPSSARPEYDPVNYDGAQGGLLGRLEALQAEQNQYQPISSENSQAFSASGGPNYEQLQYSANRDPSSSIGLSSNETSTPPLVTQQHEIEQAQQAREAAAARLVRSVKDLARTEAAPPDLVDVAKSTGIGLANGAINAIGFIPDALTGFGYFPRNAAINLLLAAYGFPSLPPDSPDYIKHATPDELRRLAESHIGNFYQPRSRAGRYAETIGEMTPMVLGGEALGIARGAQMAGAALRELPATLAKHAVAPGVVVQALEERLPNSGLARTVQKAYPVVLRTLPAALAAERYLSGRVVR